MADHYLVAHSPLEKRTMDFFLREDGCLLVDEEGMELPFTVEPEAVHALLTYLEERRELIEATQKELIQKKLDIQELYPGTDVSPRFEFVEFDEEKE
jgi:hypothetical protein